MSGSRLLRAVLRSWLGFSLRTTRWQFEAPPKTRALLLAERKGGDVPGLLVAFWHEELALSPALWWWTEPRNPSMQLHVLISKNHDGRMIADVVSPWRIPAIHGSSDSKGKSKGGAAALRRIRQVLRSGHVVAITPDGPRGPRRQVQQGVAALAAQMNVPVLPVGMMCRCVRARSWDRMVLPLPFGRGRIVCGAPLYVAPGQKEAAAAELTRELNAASTAAARQWDGEGDALFSMPVTRKHTSGGSDQLWSGLTTLLAPALTAMLHVRRRRGKEIDGRLRERMGLAPVKRPAGRLIWFHAASVGETISVLPVIRSVLTEAPDVTVLLTTGTVTAAQIAQREANASGRFLHQFVPLDVPRWVGRFLAKWQPAGLVLTESELWPSLIRACHRQHIPVMVLNGRMSPRALKGWRRAPRFAQRMMSRLTWVAARSPEDAARFRQLGADPVFCYGDLKLAAAPLAPDQTLLDRARTATGNRPVWIAASTHPGEDETILAAAQQLQAQFPGLLTIIAPRHPERGAEIARLTEKARLTTSSVPRRSAGQFPAATDAVWIIDTLGELGTVFQLSPVVFMGNSLFPRAGGGGHNPFEPARSGCTLLTGPQTGNFEEACLALQPVLHRVASAADLVREISHLLHHPEQARAEGQQAQMIATHETDLPLRMARQILETACH